MSCCNNYNNRSSCGCTNNNSSCSCSNCSRACRPPFWSDDVRDDYFPPIFPFPPQNSASNTCPPGTRPCRCPWNNFCGGWQNFDPRRNVGEFAFLNTSGSTITTGGIVPLRYVNGTGFLAKDTSGGVINLDGGTYTAEFSFNATAPFAERTITVTPQISGTVRSDLSRSFTTSVASQAFDISNTFAFNVSCDSPTTLSFIVTITGDTETDVTTLTSVNSSLVLKRICR